MIPGTSLMLPRCFPARYAVATAGQLHATAAAHQQGRRRGGADHVGPDHLGCGPCRIWPPNSPRRIKHTRNSLGNLALMTAARDGDEKVVAILLEAGADGGLRKSSRQNAREIVRAAGRAAIAEMMK